MNVVYIFYETIKISGIFKLYFRPVYLSVWSRKFSSNVYYQWCIIILTMVTANFFHRFSVAERVMEIFKKYFSMLQN